MTPVKHGPKRMRAELAERAAEHKEVVMYAKLKENLSTIKTHFPADVDVISWLADPDWDFIRALASLDVIEAVVYAYGYLCGAAEMVNKSVIDLLKAYQLDGQDDT